ncbi:MAG: DUF2339 domain-containing protein [Bacteroidales bacterium]|nr:DUF2339 domain-containing protein [Bacteroidales bacterium]
MDTESTNQLVQQMLTLMSQRENLDKEIENLRRQINSSIATEKVLENVEPETPAATPPPFEFVQQPEEAPAPPPFEQPAPPTVQAAPPQPSLSAPNEDAERNIGVKWMAYGGIFIAVIGLIIGIKVLLDRNLLGSLGRVILGYIASAAMLGVSFKAPKERKVLKYVFLFGGTTLAYAVTALAYGYFDLFSSPATLAVMWLITTTVCAFAFIKGKKALFNYGFFAFSLSPFFAGYDMGTKNATIFWVIFSLGFNAGLLAVYKYKKWSSTLTVSFVSTFIICMVKFFDGYDFSHFSNVLFFFGLTAIFYIGAVILIYQKENFNSLFIAFTILNLLQFAIFSSIEFHNKQYISYTFVALSAVLAITAFVFQRISDKKVLFSMPFSAALFFINLALLVRYSVGYPQWFPMVFAIEILAAFLVYNKTKFNYYKYLTIVLAIGCYVVVYPIYYSFDFIYESYVPRFLVLNPFFLGMMLYSAVIVYILMCGSLGNKTLFSIFAFVTIIIAVNIEVLHYWNSFDTSFPVKATTPLSMLTAFIVFGLVSVGLSHLPKTIESLSTFRTIAQVFVIFTILFFCLACLPALENLRNIIHPNRAYFAWRYISVAVALAILVFIVRGRKSALCSNYDVYCDLTLAISLIFIVSFEICNIAAIALGVSHYTGTNLTLWFGVSTLALIFTGLRLKMKYLRILGFVMAGVTIFKLFFVDIWNSELWVKAVVFVAVGVIFMLVSFIYTKNLKKENDGQNMGN